MLWGGGRFGFWGEGLLSHGHRNELRNKELRSRELRSRELSILQGLCGSGIPSRDAAGLRNGVCGQTKPDIASKDHLSTDKDNGLKAKKRGFDWSRKSCTRH